jgi:hypothetical protein
MRYLPVSIAVGILVLISGCQSKVSNAELVKGDTASGFKGKSMKGVEGKIVGEWTGTEPAMMGGGTLKETLDFNDNGTYSLTTLSGDIASVTSGTYTYSEAAKTVALTLQRMTMAGSEAKIGSGLLQPGKAVPVTWKGADEISFTQGATTYDLKRT